MTAEFTTLLKQAIEGAKTFALVSLPGESEWYLYGESTDHSRGRVTIFPFGKSPKKGMTLYLTEKLPNVSGTIAPLETTEDIREDEYARRLDEVISNLRISRGKAVISRTVTVASQRPPQEIIREYFALHPDTFRFVFHTSEFGLWFGATPEMIASVDNVRIHTMALAGSRVRGSRSEWDYKNTEEHRFVVKHIMEKLEELGITVEIKPAETLAFGPVEHLAHKITGKCSKETDIFEITSQLSPTPAICGRPIDEALQLIEKAELHSRGCYGGEIIVCDETHKSSWLSLRCAQAAPNSDGWSYRLYAGGGITCDSITADEWLETSLKMRSLLEIITRHTSAETSKGF